MEVDGRGDRAALVGPSGDGWVYRAGAAFYRLLPAQAAPLARRHPIHQWVGRPAPAGVAALTGTGWVEGDGRYFVVRYHVAGAGGHADGDCTLADALLDPSPCRRLDAAVEALRALAGWWEWWRGLEQPGGKGPLLPLPADVVLVRGGPACLLPLPFWRLPGPAEVFAEPARGYYLAPELVRGTARPRSNGGWERWENIDRYALGVALTRCFYQLPPANDPATVLRRVAGGAALDSPALWADLPFWMARARGAAEAREIVALLVHPDPAKRAGLAPRAVADRLADCRRRMEPRAAAEELTNVGNAAEAFALLQDVLQGGESYDLLVQAARVAARHLGRPLQAIDLLERAIARDGERPDAYEEQLRLLVVADRQRPLVALIESHAGAGRQLDDKVLRDFDRLPEPAREELEVGVADYLLWRERYDVAAGFIYPRIVAEGQGLWWKVGMNLDYARALTRLGQFDAARSQHAFLRAALERGWQAGLLTEEEVQHSGQQLVEEELLLEELTKGSP